MPFYLVEEIDTVTLKTNIHISPIRSMTQFEIVRAEIRLAAGGVKTHSTYQHAGLYTIQIELPGENILQEKQDLAKAINQRLTDAGIGRGLEMTIETVPGQ